MNTTNASSRLIGNFLKKLSLAVSLRTVTYQCDKQSFQVSLKLNEFSSTRPANFPTLNALHWALEEQLKHYSFCFRYLVDSVNDGVVTEISIERHEREVLKSKKEVGNR